MYAIISDGNRQYRVEEGQELVINYRDVPAGEKIKFEQRAGRRRRRRHEARLAAGEGRERGGRSARPGEGREARHPENAPPQKLPPQNGRAAYLHARARREDQRVRLIGRVIGSGTFNVGSLRDLRQRSFFSAVPLAAFVSYPGWGRVQPNLILTRGSFSTSKFIISAFVEIGSVCGVVWPCAWVTADEAECQL